MHEDRLRDVITPVLEQHALELDALELVPAGQRTLLRVTVDGDGPDGTGPLLDDIAEATRALSSALDESGVDGRSPYTLEVSSRGVSRPLERPAHWRRNRGRLVSVRPVEGAGSLTVPITARIVDVDEQAVTLDEDGTTRTVVLADVAKAVVQVELNRPGKGPAPEQPEHAEIDEEA